MLRAKMAESRLSHLVVYADREHFANLTYLTGFDPRFEEALLVLKSEGHPLLIVGNETVGYLPVSPLYRAGKLRTELFQPFSLLDQPRDDSRLIREILADEDISPGAIVGCAGWKYFAESEHPDSRHTIELPSYIVDTLRQLAGEANVMNASDIFMHPDYGLRTFCSVSEIAYFEYTNMVASDGMKRMLFAIRDGMSDFELAKQMQYDGLPFACHTTLVTGDTREAGMTSPVGAIIRRGDPLATNISYWGCNSCRAGWVASGAGDLPMSAQDYVDAFAGPYFSVLAQWLQHLRIGTVGDTLANLITTGLPFDRFGIFLNPGHLIHLDEWLSSPIYSGSSIALHSGMALQVDVIPSSPVYFSTRMEDGVVLADKGLRDQLRQAYPDCYERCQQRRGFMADVLGIELADEVLPLSNIPGIVPPFFLEPHRVFALR
jgi:Xaa-Pro aminopeptidase